MAILTITARLKNDLGVVIPVEMIRPEAFATLRSLVELVHCYREPKTDQMTRHHLPEESTVPAESIVDEYNTNGYAVLRGVVDPELIREIHTHVRWLGERYPTLRPEDYHHPLMRDDAFWVRVVTDPRLVDIAQTILGPDLACFTSHYVCKPAHDGRAVLWHQDAAYWELQPMQALTVWLAVDDSSLDNGCLQVIPGSHRSPIYPQASQTRVPNMLMSMADANAVQEWIDRAGIVPLELAPVDVSIHHPHILHHSEPNASPRRRCGLDIGYIPTSTRVLNKGLYLNPILVRGNPVEGINSYRPYPPFDPAQSIAFHGHERWNSERAGSLDSCKAAVGSEETPLQITNRMMSRLRDGTVKQ